MRRARCRVMGGVAAPHHPPKAADVEQEREDEERARERFGEAERALVEADHDPDHDEREHEHGRLPPEHADRDAPDPSFERERAGDEDRVAPEDQPEQPRREVVRVGPGGVGPERERGVRGSVNRRGPAGWAPCRITSSASSVAACPRGVWTVTAWTDPDSHSVSRSTGMRVLDADVETRCSRQRPPAGMIATIRSVSTSRCKRRISAASLVTRPSPGNTSLAG